MGVRMTSLAFLLAGCALGSMLSTVIAQHRLSGVTACICLFTGLILLLVETI